MTDPPPLAQLSEVDRAAAMRRYEVIRPQVEDGVPLARAAAAGVPLRTAVRWLARYRRDGLTGLARSPRLDRGHRRLPPELVALVEALALHRPRPSAAQVHRQVSEVAAVRRLAGSVLPMGLPSGPRPGTGEPGLVTLAHDGPKVYRPMGVGPADPSLASRCRCSARSSGSTGWTGRTRPPSRRGSDPRYADTWPTRECCRR